MNHHIAAFETFHVRLPIQAPMRHSYGVHTAFDRTLLRLTTEDGTTGWGETAAPKQEVDNFASLVLGESPFHLETLRMHISQRGYFSRQALIGTVVEIACLDLQGRILGCPVSHLLGGTLRSEVPLSAYVFYRYETDDKPEVKSPEEVVRFTQELIAADGFRTVKLKGGVHPPEHDVRVIQALSEALGPDVLLRLDPNAVWTPETAIRIGTQIDRLGINLEYLEDPTWGIDGMSAVRSKVQSPLATNMCVTYFDHLPHAIDMRAVDIVLSDPWYWGGLFNTKVLSVITSTFGLGMGMHSGLETGIGLSAMLHVSATLPNLTHAIDSHYHHLLDDILQGERLKYRQGCMAVPQGPGLGVEVDMEKVKFYQVKEQAETDRKTGGPDPRRSAWYPQYPGW
jgi:glucarate dehydratase